MYTSTTGLVPKTLYREAKRLLSEENRQISDLMEKSIAFYVELRQRGLVQDNGDLDHALDNAVVLLEFLRSLKENSLIANEDDLREYLQQIITERVLLGQNSQRLDNQD